MTEGHDTLDSLGDDTLVAEPEIVVRARRPWGLLIAALLFLALWAWREAGIRVGRENVQSQQAEINRLLHENDTLAQQLENTSSQLSALSSGSRTVALTGQRLAPGASGRAFLGPQAGQAQIFFYHLPANPRNRSYQLWITGPKGENPVSGGTFDVPRRGSASLTVNNLPPSGAREFAVTLEQKGGSDLPGSEYYLLGAVTP